jgi:hypothetical protein
MGLPLAEAEANREDAVNKFDDEAMLGEAEGATC